MTDDFTPEKTPRSRPRRRESHQQISSLQIVFAAILSIGLLLVINFSGRIARGQQMENARQRVQATIDVLQAEKLALLKERDYSAGDASIEDWAHSEGKMVRENEILVIPIPSGQTGPTPIPTVAPIIASTSREDETSNWQLWWNLFFDGKPPF